jgi:hypothetical protein
MASDPLFQTWLSSFDGPRGISKLCRKARIATLIATAFEAIGECETMPSLVWGSTFDCIDVLDSMSDWGYYF